LFKVNYLCSLWGLLWAADVIPENAIQRQTLDILAWATDAEIYTVPFVQFRAIQDYEAMMLHFTKKYKKDTPINKHRQRFWATNCTLMRTAF
jgi:hypothetical protein